MPALQHLLGGLLVLTLAVSVVTDLRWRRILDLVTYPAMGLALALRASFEGLGSLDTGAGSGLAGLALAAGAFGAIAFFGGGLGWGDVKLAGVMGATLGFPRAMTGLLLISLVGAAQAVISLIWQGDLSATVRRVLTQGRGEGGVDTPQRHIPYGVAIALGSLWAMWWDGNA